MNENAQTALIDIFSEQAGAYDAGVAFFRPLAASLLRHAGVGPGQDVLDVGCGRGAVLFQAADLVGPGGHVTGIDLADGMVAETAADAKQRGLDTVTVSKMDGHSPDFPAGSFDRVLGSMSIVMIPDLAGAFGNYHAVLREGGVLGFTAPAVGTNPGQWQLGPLDLGTLLTESWDSLTPQGQADIESTLGMFSSLDPDSLLGDLRTAGFDEPRAIQEPFTLTARSGKEFVDWTFSHGMRYFWSALPEDRRAELAASTAERVDADRDSDGVARYPFPVRYFLATK